MAQERAVVRVHGVSDPGDEALGPFLPLVVEINADAGALAVGDAVEFVVRGRVQAITPIPIDESLVLRD